MHDEAMLPFDELIVEARSLGSSMIEFAMPNKLFEATLSGNPIICSDLLEMGPFVSENSLGLTYSADSPEHCAVKMLELIKNYGQFERSVARQIELNEKYSWEAQERKLIAMYQELNTN